ncbi:MAG: beta-ketoacyl synthase chain length factor [Deltaproteobacteria bacterium]|nr:beta-ketoacyl synthase chain length factor [Candidatus Tharpella sp.]
MFPLAINGIGPVGAFGAGMADLKAALSNDIKITPEIARIQTRAGDYDLPIFRADSKPLAEFIKPRKLRRLDNFSRLALLGAVLAVKDTAMDLTGPQTGLIVASAHGASATTFAFLDSVIDDGDALASPTMFSNSVHNAAASHIAEHFAITGPTLSLTQGSDSLTMALLTAGQWLESGRVDTILCGVIDCYCDVLGYCWQSYHNQSKSPKPKPAPGPGEGSLFLQLSRIEENAPPPKYGYLGRIELNRNAPPAALPFINTGTDCSNQLISGSGLKTVSDSCKNQLQINLNRICGGLPVPTSFDLAAAASLISDKHLYNRYDRQKTAAVPTTETICCWQPRPGIRQKPLTGNCYWITNHADLNPGK